MANVVETFCRKGRKERKEKLFYCLHAFVGRDKTLQFPAFFWVIQAYGRINLKCFSLRSLRPLRQELFFLYGHLWPLLPRQLIRSASHAGLLMCCQCVRTLQLPGHQAAG